MTDFLRKLFVWRAHGGTRATQHPPPAAGGAADASSLLVFDHIPKTAGTTFRRSYLIAAFPRDQRWILSGGEKNAEDLARFLQLSEARRRRIRVVAGHNAESLRSAVPDARFVTLVRNPVDRSVSMYLHALFHPGGEQLWSDVREQRMGIRDFILKYEPPNAQSAQLLGPGSFDEAGIRQRLAERYALVGYTEAFEQFVFMLHVREGFPLCLYNNRLVRPERESYTPSAEDVEFIRDRNSQDVLLHRVVSEIFQQQIDRLEPAALARLAKYRGALERFRATTQGDPAESIRLDDDALDREAAGIPLTS